MSRYNVQNTFIEQDGKRVLVVPKSLVTVYDFGSTFRYRSSEMRINTDVPIELKKALVPILKDLARILDIPKSYQMKKGELLSALEGRIIFTD